MQMRLADDPRSHRTMAEALQKDTKESITVTGTTYLRREGLGAKTLHARLVEKA
jgi:hypothetical protein